MSSAPELAVLVPAYNEEESIGPLIDHLTEVLGKLGRTYEILIVDDGSNDSTCARVEERIPGNDCLRLIAFQANAGKSAALETGFRAVSATAAVVTIDADLQDEPEEIPGMLSMLDEGYDLVSGWKRRRRDPWTKRLPSRIFNLVTALITGIKLHDFNCGFKAYKRQVVDGIELHGELHRYIPVLAGRLGWRIGEREVRHHPRRHGRSKFGSARFINGFLDLLLVMFLSGKHRSPLHVFGRLGLLFLIVGGGLLVYMAGIWVVERHLRVRPLMIGGVISVILGIQFISMGLLAEMIAGIRKPRNVVIRKVLPEEEDR